MLVVKERSQMVPVYCPTPPQVLLSQGFFLLQSTLSECLQQMQLAAAKAVLLGMLLQMKKVLSGSLFPYW